MDITDATFTHGSSTKEDNLYNVDMRVVINGEVLQLKGEGNGRLDAVQDALTKTQYDIQYDFITYSENAMTVGSKSKAAAYVCIADKNGTKYWGVGTQPDIILASVNALVSAINRMNKVNKFM